LNPAPQIIKTMADRLDVSLFGRLVGILTIHGPLRSPEDWVFQYLPDHLSGNPGSPVSVRMPVRREAYSGAVVRNWACNLLPEGDARQSIGEQFPDTTPDEFDLLSLLGGECAGAVAFHPGEGSAPIGGCLLDNADAVDLEAILRKRDPNTWWSPLNLVGRRALAGAQDKLAVVVEPDGVVRLPVEGEWSTHLIKPDSPRLPGLCEREALGMGVAEAIGLPVAKTRPITIAGRHAFLIERYDRVVTTSGDALPVHQEDFCQVFGLPPEFKYQSPNGVSLANIVGWCRDELPREQDAVSALLSWTAFNLLIGNADAHAKNLSILRDIDGHICLAPFYDLVPTISFSETLVDRTPALRIGAAESIDAVTHEDLRTLAIQSDWEPAQLLDRVDELASRLLVALPVVAGNLADEGCRPDVLHRVRGVVEEQCHRMAAIC